MNFSGVRLDMSFKEAKELDEMIARNIARPMEEVKYEWQGEEHVYYRCPVCGDSLIGAQKFCSKCGQRIDTENIAF